MSDWNFNDEDLEALYLIDIYENNITSFRVAEILDDPTLVPGTFDFQHLADVHRYIFQDFPDKWIEQNEATEEFFHYLQPEMLSFQPGQLRESREPFNPIEKYRELAKGKLGSVSHYSCNNEEDLAHADQLLQQVQPSIIKNLPQEEIKAKMVDLYQELDFIHPFAEGNSRTLRTFTTLLAQEAGVNLQWSKLDHDALYAARDMSLNQKTIDYYTQKSNEDPFDTGMIERASENLANLKSKGYKSMQALFEETDIKLHNKQLISNRNETPGMGF